MRYQLKKPAGRQYYDLRWTDKAGRHKKGTGKQTKLEAEAWAIQFFKDYVPGESGKLTVGDLVENFLAVQKVKYPSRHANAVYPWETRTKDKFAYIEARKLSGRDTLNYINWCVGVEVKGWAPLEKPLAKATANKDVAILQGAYTHAKKADDFRHRQHFSTHDVSDSVREGFLEQREFDAIAAVVRDMRSDYLWLRAYLTMAYECGNRRGELATLRVSQFNRIERFVRLRGLDTKSGKPRELGLV